MPYDEITLGAAPSEENPVPAPYKNEAIAAAAYTECENYIKQLREIFPEIPRGLRLEIKLNPYTFRSNAARGGYYDVIAKYHELDEEAISYAFFMDRNRPQTWHDKEPRMPKSKESLECSDNFLQEDCFYEPVLGFTHQEEDGLLVFDNDIILVEGQNEPFQITSIIENDYFGLNLNDAEGKKFASIYRLHQPHILYVILHSKEQLRFPCEDEFDQSPDKFPELFKETVE